MATVRYSSKLPARQSQFQLPDPPPRHPDEMTAVDHVHEPGHTHHLAQYLGNPDTTLVTAERYIVRELGSPATERRVPDLLIAFGVDPAAYRARNGLRHRGAGQAAGLRAGSGLAEHRRYRCRAEAG